MTLTSTSSSLLRVVDTSALEQHGRYRKKKNLKVSRADLPQRLHTTAGLFECTFFSMMVANLGLIGILSSLLNL